MKKGLICLVSIIMLISVLGTSCSSSKGSLAYFQNLDSKVVEQGLGSNDYGVKVVLDDELKIVITSQVPEATAPYNLPLANYANATELTASASPAIQTYVVDKDGCITLPVIGKLKVVGKTTDEITAEIKSIVEKDVNNPYVLVKLCGFRVNVLGEVKDPGAKNVTKERYSIFDAVAEAGDLTEFGKRDIVLLIREENGVKKYVRLNLSDVAILESPYYYLQQNDIIYVEPNEIKVDNSKYNQNNAFKMSVVSTIVSALSVIASVVIALTIK